MQVYNDLANLVMLGQNVQPNRKSYMQLCVSESENEVIILLCTCPPSPPQGAREENTAVDMAKAQREAQELYQAGEKKWGTDESKFNQIIAVRSFPQLRATFDEYVRVNASSFFFWNGWGPYELSGFPFFKSSY